jgi:chromosome segregation ATPase
MDMVSPATRLLEKRRQMYEEQIKYDDKIKETKRHELEFRETEKEIRQKDLAMMESMIQFSVFLQSNDQQKMQAKEKKGKEQQMKQDKEEEHSTNQKKTK